MTPITQELAAIAKARIDAGESFTHTAEDLGLVRSSMSRAIRKYEAGWRPSKSHKKTPKKKNLQSWQKDLQRFQHTLPPPKTAATPPEERRRRYIERWG